MPTNDSAFKWLVSFRPQDYVDRFCPGARFVRMLPTELSREPLRADALVEVEPPKAKGKSPGNFALHLFPFLKGATLATLDPVVAALDQIPDPAQRSSSLYDTIAFAERVFTPATVTTFLRRNVMLDKLIKDSPFYQEIRKEGLAEGRTEGLAEGVEQGQLHTLRRSILRVVQRRFTPLFAVAEAHISTMTDVDRLQVILDDLPYAPDEAAAKHILGLPE